jgi:hypothetical protein
MHIDDLLGVAAVAAAGMLAAIAAQPMMSGARGATDAPATAASIVRLPSVEVTARRSVEFARIEREEKFACPSDAKNAVRPKA